MAKCGTGFIIAALVLSGCVQSGYVVARNEPPGQAGISSDRAHNAQDAARGDCPGRSGVNVLSRAVLSGEVGVTSIH